MERCFHFGFSRCVNRASLIILPLFLVWIIFALYCITQISPKQHQEAFLPSNHRTLLALKSLKEDFPQARGDQLLTMTLFWGIEGIDRSGISLWDADNYGSVVYLEAFDVSEPANQQTIVDWCDSLLTKKYLLEGGPDHEKVFCFMKAFQTFLQGQGKRFPVAQSDFNSELLLFTADSSSLAYRKAGVYGFDEEGKVAHVQI